MNFTKLMTSIGVLGLSLVFLSFFEVNKPITNRNSASVAPSIALSSEVIDFTITECGDSSRIRIDLMNIGDEPLTYEVQNNAANNTPSILSLNNNVDLSQEYVNTIDAINEYFTDYTISTINTTDGATLETALADADILLIPEQEFGNPFEAGSELVPVINDYVNNGGYVILLGNDFTVVSDIQLFAIDNTTGSLSSDQVTITMPDDPFVANANPTYNASNANIGYQFTDSNVITVAEVTNLPDFAILAYRDIGLGRAVYFGPDFFEYNDDEARIIANLCQNANLGFPDWLTSVTPAMNTIAPLGSDTLSFLVETANIVSGNYTTTVVLTTNDPANPTVEITVNLDLTGAAALELSATEVTFPSIPIGTSTVDTIIIRNSGCDTLDISNFLFSDPVFSSSITTPLEVLPFDTLIVPLTFMADEETTYNETLTIQSNLPDVVVSLMATGNPAPFLVLNPTSLEIELTNCDEMGTFPFAIENQGSGELSFNLSLQSNTLENLLEGLEQNSTNITDLIPNRFEFTGGETGSSIGDGGGDMYDTGNILSTDLGNLSYSNKNITDAAATLGMNGRYFTAKYPGLFVFSADINNISGFFISGGLGADGSGQTDNTLLTTTLHGTNYTGYVKRVYNASDPSVNHLIITETDPAINQVTAASTDLDDHLLENIEGVRRIYYLLFSTSDGSFIPDATIQSIMEEFLAILAPGDFAGISWLDIDNTMGMVAPMGSTTINAAIDATGLVAGQYNADIIVASNSPANPEVIFPITLTLTGTPVADLSATSYDFGMVQRSTTKTDTLKLYNSGCSTLTVSDVQIDNAEFSAELESTTIAPFDSTCIVLTFAPTMVQNSTATLNLTTDGGNINATLTGEGIGIPEMVVTPLEVETTITKCDQNQTLSFMIENIGEELLDWSISSQADLDLDNFDDGIDDSKWMINDGRASVDCGSQSGNALVMDGANRIAQTQNINTLGGGVLSFYIKIANGFMCDGAEGGEDVALEYSTDNGSTWTNIMIFNEASYPDLTLIEIDLTDIVTDANTQFRWIQNIFSGSDFDVWVLDEIIITRNQTSSDLTFNATDGSLTANDNQVVEFTIPADLTEGEYSYLINVQSNDPNNPSDFVSVSVTVENRSILRIDQTKLDFGTIGTGSSSSQGLVIYNDGCDSLRITDFTFSNPAFNTTSSSLTIAPGSAGAIAIDFRPMAAGNYNNFLTIVSSGQNTDIALCGVAEGDAEISVSPTEINATISSCPIIPLSDVTVENIGSATLNYDIQPVEITEKRSEQTYTTDGATTNHVLTDLPMLATDEMLEITITLNGDFNSQTEQALLTIEGNSQGTIDDQNLPNGTDIVQTFTYTGTVVQSWTTDGRITINLTNSPDVDVNSGGDNRHSVIVRAVKKSDLITVSENTMINPDDSFVHQVNVSDPVPADGTYELALHIPSNDLNQPNLFVPINLVIDVAVPTVTNEIITCDPNAVGTTERVLVASNGCDSLVIDNTILDNIAPTANCVASFEVDLSQGAQTISLNQLDAGSSDNCTSNAALRFSNTANPSSNTLTVTCDMVGMTDITLWVTDAAGNQGTCTVTLDVVDPDNACICGQDVFVFYEEPITPDSYRARNTIVAFGVVETTTNVEFRAGNEITLGRGFTVEAGATFLATIEDCTVQAATNEEVTERTKESSEQLLPAVVALELAPNVFAQSTRITYELPAENAVYLAVYDAHGKQVRELLNDMQQLAGQHHLDFTAQQLNSGLYYVQLNVGGELVVRKMIIR